MIRNDDTILLQWQKHHRADPLHHFDRHHLQKIQNPHQPAYGRMIQKNDATYLCPSDRTKYHLHLANSIDGHEYNRYPKSFTIGRSDICKSVRHHVFFTDTSTASDTRTAYDHIDDRNENQCPD